MDRNVLLAVILSVLVIFLFQRTYAPQKPGTQAAASVSQNTPQGAAVIPSKDSGAGEINLESYSSRQNSKTQTFTGENDYTRITFDACDAVMRDYTVKRIPVVGALKTPVVFFKDVMPPYCPGFVKGVDDGSIYSLISSKTDGVVFEKPLQDGSVIRKTYHVKAPFSVEMEISFKVKENGTVSFPEGIAVGSGAFFPTPKAYNQGDFGIINLLQGNKIKRIAPKSAADAFYGNILWAGIKDSYYASTICPIEAQGVSSSGIKTLPTKEAGLEGISAFLYSAPLTAGLGETKTLKYLLYIGPKHYGTLKEAGRDLDLLMDFGMFGFISKIILWLLNTLYGYVSNYGVAILLVTLIMRLILYPLNRKSIVSMRKMQELAPKIKGLQDKYKSDQPRLQQELMALYRSEKVNPFGGCMPMLLQIPIFFALFSVLRSAIELQGASFLWIKNLAMPDTIARIGGLPLNPLPLLMCGTTFLQQKLTTSQAAQNQQQKMMMYMMPFMFLFFFYSAPSGLALYWTFLNILSIGEQYLIKK